MAQIDIQSYYIHEKEMVIISCYGIFEMKIPYSIFIHIYKDIQSKRTDAQQKIIQLTRPPIVKP